MRAAVYQSRGTLGVEDVAKPVPSDKQVLIRTHATTICAADYRLSGLGPPLTWLMGLRHGKILGMEFSGRVEASGRAATRFRPGDHVFGLTGFKLGAHAEYVCAQEEMVESAPTNLSLEDSAAVAFGGITALTHLRLAKIQPGQDVLIYGASGSVGVFAVQLAKYFGARVTGVCSGANAKMVLGLGADRVIDYTQEDFSAAGRIYDVVFDAVGKSGFRRTLRALKRGRPYVRVAPSGGIPSILRDIPVQLGISLSGSAKVLGGLERPQPGDLGFLRQLVEAGELQTVIDRRYPLAETNEALRYAAGGHKRGHVLVIL